MELGPFVKIIPDEDFFPDISISFNSWIKNVIQNHDEKNVFI